MGFDSFVETELNGKHFGTQPPIIISACVCYWNALLFTPPHVEVVVLGFLWIAKYVWPLKPKTFLIYHWFSMVEGIIYSFISVNFFPSWRIRNLFLIPWIRVWPFPRYPITWVSFGYTPLCTGYITLPVSFSVICWCTSQQTKVIVCMRSCSSTGSCWIIV